MSLAQILHVICFLGAFSCQIGGFLLYALARNDAGLAIALFGPVGFGILLALTKVFVGVA
jgi:hypothetical protein